MTTELNAASMPLLDHLRELRSRLIKCLIALGVGMLFALPLSYRVIDGLVAMCPVCQIQVIAPTESIITYFRVSIIMGLVVATPIILYQIIAFISPGLHPGEQRMLLLLLPGAGLLFALGLAFGYYIALPRAVMFLSTFLQSMASANWTLANYVAFVTNLLLVIGLTFQTPLVIFVLAKLNLVTPPFLRHYRRHAIVLMAVISAVLTPTPDPLTMLLVLFPMLLLYELGIILAWFATRGKARGAASGDVT